MRCFRWVKPAASLKHLAVAKVTPPRDAGFRWVKPAASLKLGCRLVGRNVLLGFPLGKTGGLIEARVVRVGLVARVNAFPLGKTGGLIEAMSCSGSTHSAPPSFRWVKPAASLKPATTSAPSPSNTTVSAG